MVAVGWGLVILEEGSMALWLLVLGWIFISFFPRNCDQEVV